MVWDVEQGCKKIVAIGRLTEEKNFAYLIDTCKKLKDNGKKFSLRIIGEGLPGFCRKDWFLNIITVLLFVGLVSMILMIL